MGIVLILVSSFFFTLSSMFGKIVTSTTNMSGILSAFFRFSIGAILMFAYIMFKGKSFKSDNMKPMILRGIFNSLAMITFSLGFQYTTITNTNMLHMSYPVFVVLFAPYFTKEKIKKSSYLYLTIIMLGSYIVANPSFGYINIGDFFAFLSAVVGAFSILYLTIASRDNESYLIVFYVMLVGTLVNLPLVLRDFATFEMAGLLPALLSGICGILGQIFITLGYRYVDSATGSMVANSRIVMGAILGYIFLDETIDLRIIIGMILIIGALVGLSGYFSKNRKEAVE